jgi:segregation and condensation protein A
MAALLAEIKSRMLLPRPPAAEEEEDDPRAELIRRLQEYECIKKAAEDLDRLPRIERDIFATHVDTGGIQAPKHFPDVQLKDILLAFQDVLRRAEQLSHHQIVKEPLSVRERMSHILERLNGIDSLLFAQLFVKKEGRHGVVVSFLAILELGKEGLIEILQTEPLAELRVRIAGGAA